MKRLPHILMAAGLVGLAASVAGANLVSLSMDQQIIHPEKTTDQSPLGHAIYEPANFGDDTLTVIPGVGSRLTQSDSRPGTGGDGWYYMYLDLNLAGIGEVDVTGQTMSFDARIYQEDSTWYDPGTDQMVTRPAYSDANIFVRVYTYAADGVTYQGHSDFGIIYGPNDGHYPFGDWYPTWSPVSIDLASGAVGGAFDPTRVSRIRWYGTDWNGNGNDFTEVRNFVITPEPASLALLAIGGLALLRRRR
jgi:hypothetical protein